MINKFSVGDKVVFSRSGIFGWEEIDESEQGDYHMGNNTYEVTEVDYTKGEEGIKLDFSNQWVHPNHFELAHYAKGGSVNTGRSWHLDRQKSNKSESWEKPMNKRKQRYDNGGGVGIDFTNFTIDEFYSFVRSINNYGDITYQVSLGNNVNKGGSAISIEKIRNISLSIGDAGRNISVMTGNENIYADILVYDNNYDKGYKEYTISLFSKDDREGLKSIVSSIIEKFANGGGVDFGEEEFGDVLCLVKYITKDGAVKEHTLMTTGGSADDVMEKLTSFKGVDVLKILSIKRMDNVMEGIYSKGGGINSGRDRLFKSKQPHEQNYKRKTEWKEYKKEGWFGDWFADGGGVDSSKVRMRLQDEGGFDEYLEEINFNFNENKIEYEDWDIIIVSKDIAEKFENDGEAYVLMGNELYENGGRVGDSIEIISAGGDGTRGYYIYNQGKKAINKSDGTYEFYDDEVEQIIGKSNMDAFYDGIGNFKIKSNKILNFDYFANGGGVDMLQDYLLIFVNNDNKVEAQLTEDYNKSRSNYFAKSTLEGNYQFKGYKLVPSLTTPINKDLFLDEFHKDVTDYFDGMSLDEAIKALNEYKAIHQPNYNPSEYENGGGVDEIIMTNEEIIRDNVVNGEIDLDTLIDIIGFEPNYPYQIVGAMKLEKCFLRPYYRIA